ncbi:MAG: DUF937 domain-containing protein [Allorhizobium sp.]
MLPLFDMMLRAQNGMAMDAMAKQFNLAQEQVAQAMAALTPAFSSGLKRSTANPYDFSALINAMTSGNYAKYFEDMSKAFTPQGIADGNSVLEQLFGSKDVSRAVAAQAAQLTGIGQDILKQMLPAMADTIMGGLFKQTTGQFADAANPFANTPMGTMMQQWLENTGFAPKARPKEQVNLFDNPFTQAMLQMFGAQKPKPAQGSDNPFLDNPFAKAFQEMMSGNYTGSPNAPSSSTQKGATKPESGDETVPGLAAMMNSMFDSGLEVQKSYQKSMEQIFDSYLDASAKKPASKPGAEDETPPGDKEA